MVRIVRHNDESVREGYIRNGGKEVQLFTSVLKAFPCNNRIVMAQRNHLDDFFYVVEFLDDWNVDVPSWKYPKNLESPRVSSPDFGNDSKMMIMGIDATAQVALELQHRMRTGIWQLLPKEVDGAQNHSCLVSSLQLLVRQFQGRPCTDAQSALVYMLVGLSDVFHLPLLTVACD
ncbi:uncharacterized protein TNCV_1724281 [Trichonephila clavipes]|nr:uncharacterized protein TNCV_1724281 [Trichonephila clavipes]